MKSHDTIAAIATGNIISAIGIVRVSGGNALTAADNIFRSSVISSLAEAKDRQMYYGQLLDAKGDIIDLCLCIISRAPKTYTGEDTVEFHCHGSPVVLTEVLQSLSVFGVRQAEAGEFTKRAFLNNRIDLMQAEAVIDIIEAETAAAAKNAAGQLGGIISKSINDIYKRLLDIIVHFQAIIDYPDEDIEEFKLHDYQNTLCECKNKLQNLLDTHSRGRLLKNGVPTAIIGRANTGKSSLLNALAGFDRAIVTDIPGTTRDTVEEKVLLGNVLLRLTDTAGLRDTNDAVEKLGQERTQDAARDARLVFAVFDGSMPLCEEDYRVLNILPDTAEVIAVVNKSDLPPAGWAAGITEETGTIGELFTGMQNPQLKGRTVRIVKVSALTREGIDRLSRAAGNLFAGFYEIPHGEVITNVRQAEALTASVNAVTAAQKAMEERTGADAVLTDIEEAASSLGQLIGKTMRDDIVSRIFERFCVGK